LIDSNDREVALRIGAHHAGLELAFIAKRNFNVRAAFDHVIVRHDEAVGADYEARPDTGLSLIQDHVRALDLRLYLDDGLARLVGDRDHCRFLGQVVCDVRERCRQRTDRGSTQSLDKEDSRGRTGKPANEGSDKRDGDDQGPADAPADWLRRNPGRWRLFGDVLGLARHP
jgi:hypothetical protein